MNELLGGKTRIALALLAAGLMPASAASNNAETCRALVSDLYKQAWPDAATTAPAFHANFEGHYNAKLGQCFALETVSQMQRSPALRENQRRETQTLSDANGKQVYGNYDSWSGMPPMKCRVQGVSCSSRQEWTRLIEPFMQE